MHYKKKVNLNLERLSKKVKKKNLIFKLKNLQKYNLLSKLKNLQKKFSPFLIKNFNFFFFINKIFNSMIKGGKKSVVINYFLSVLNILISKRNKLIKKSYFILVYFLQIALKLLPCFLYVNLKKRGNDYIVPWLIRNKKLNKKKIFILGTSWLKKSYKNRKEKTVFLKLFSELEGTRVGVSESTNLKNIYYKNFYENKRYIKFLKTKLWT